MHDHVRHPLGRLSKLVFLLDNRLMKKVQTPSDAHTSYIDYRRSYRRDISSATFLVVFAFLGLFGETRLGNTSTGGVHYVLHGDHATLLARGHEEPQGIHTAAVITICCNSRNRKLGGKPLDRSG